ncbi:phosphoglycerate mutase family protein, partial [Gemmatimonadota bacterium]
MRVRNTGLILFSSLLLGLLAEPAQAQDQTLIFLVRHAEKVDDGSADPALTEAGRVRARLLAEMLKDVGLTHVHSSDYLRTRTTAGPAAEAAGLEVTLYDPRDLGGFATHLLGVPGRHLVVGHSNTNPELVAALGGDPHGTIDDLEYDRLYLVEWVEG